MLAARKRAFLVTCLLLGEQQIDPLIQNEDGEDLFDVIKIIYGEVRSRRYVTSPSFYTHPAPSDGPRSA